MNAAARVEGRDVVAGRGDLIRGGRGREGGCSNVAPRWTPDPLLSTGDNCGSRCSATADSRRGMSQVITASTTTAQTGSHRATKRRRRRPISARARSKDSSERLAIMPMQARHRDPHPALRPPPLLRADPAIDPAVPRPLAHHRVVVGLAAEAVVLRGQHVDEGTRVHLAHREFTRARVGEHHLRVLVVDAHRGHAIVERVLLSVHGVPVAREVPGAPQAHLEDLPEAVVLHHDGDALREEPRLALHQVQDLRRRGPAPPDRAQQYRPPSPRRGPRSAPRCRRSPAPRPSPRRRRGRSPRTATR